MATSSTPAAAILSRALFSPELPMLAIVGLPGGPTAIRPGPRCPVRLGAKIALRDQLLTARNRRSLLERSEVARAIARAPDRRAGGTPGGHRGGVRRGRLRARHRPRCCTLLAAAGKRVILPVLLPDGDLDWAVYAGDQGLVPARLRAARAGRAAARCRRGGDRRRGAGARAGGVLARRAARAAAAAPTTGRWAGCRSGRSPACCCTTTRSGSTCPWSRTTGRSPPRPIPRESRGSPRRSDVSVLIGSHSWRVPARARSPVPTYQYACTECGHAFEQVQSFTDDALTECPECEGRLRKLFNAVGVVFKGSGFYRTDSRGTAVGDERLARRETKTETEDRDQVRVQDRASKTETKTATPSSARLVQHARRPRSLHQPPPADACSTAGPTSGPIRRRSRARSVAAMPVLRDPAALALPAAVRRAVLRPPPAARRAVRARRGAGRAAGRGRAAARDRRRSRSRPTTCGAGAVLRAGRPDHRRVRARHGAGRATSATRWAASWPRRCAAASR